MLHFTFESAPYKDKFFVLNHVAYSGACRSAKDGSACGILDLDGITPTDAMEALNAETGELFVGVRPRYPYGTLGILCINLNTIQISVDNCGLFTFPSIAGILYANLETIGSKYFMISGAGELHCFDIVLKGFCGVWKTAFKSDFPGVPPKTTLLLRADP